MLNRNRGRYDIIYADAHVRVSVKSQSVSANLQQSVKSADRKLWPQVAKKPPDDNQFFLSEEKM